MHAGPDELVVAAKIAVHPSDSGMEIVRDVDKAEKSLRDPVPCAKYTVVEPDLDRGRRTDSEDTELNIDNFDANIWCGLFPDRAVTRRLMWDCIGHGACAHTRGFS